MDANQAEVKADQIKAKANQKDLPGRMEQMNANKEKRRPTE
jgi:hypothetical protein